MKRLIYILFLTSLVLSSCNEELWQENSVEQDGIKLTIYNSTLTKATDSGEGYERKIKTLDCFFYPKGQTDKPCVFYHPEVVADNSTGRVDVIISVVEDVIRKIFPTEGECEVFVIANLPDSVKPDNIEFNSDPTNEFTSLDNLKEYVLQLADDDNPNFVATYDAQNEPFVMTGLATGFKTSKKNCTATVPLKRAASKVTLRVAIPPFIKIKNENYNSLVAGSRDSLIMIPVFADNTDAVTLRSALHNGAEKAYLFKDSDENVNKDLFSTEKYSFTYRETIKKKKNQSIDSLYVYECNVPFYTYAREWEKGAADAAYMTFEMPWGEDTNDDGKPDTNTKTYFYQILVNGKTRSFQPNYWYDMFVKVGVIGSTVENIPMLLDYLMFYVLDWTDQDADVNHPEHDVELDIYHYLNIQNPVIELDNENTALIKYNATHDIKWEVKSAYTINNSGVSASTTNVTIGNDTNFSDDEKGTLTFIRNIGSSEYAPTYITLNVWLDLDDDGALDENEREFLREVKITQYPPMYVIRDVSCLRSVYVNGMRGTGNISNYNLGNNSNYPLGYYQGIRNNDYQNTNYSMFIISVSSFNSNDTFEAPLINNDGCLNVDEGNRNSNPNPQTKPYKYIIGDPRVRDSEVNLDGEAVSGLWAEGEALYPENSGKRRLQNYYPTESFGNSFQVVAPKFRIVSFNNASGKLCNAKSAAMRCASVQEDGYPAGRWRLPTVAEIQYIIKLQKAGAIQEIFSTTSNSISCYATASYGNTNKSHRITMSLIGNDVRWNNIQNEISVRCVYDDWFWGSNRDAKPGAVNANGVVVGQDGEARTGDDYLFTWGDMPISWN